VPHFVYLSKASNADVTVGQAFKIVAAAFAFLAAHYGGRKEENALLDVVHFGLELGWHFYCLKVFFHLN
jgi:hypothetical protein